MGREELRAALEELTASLAATEDDDVLDLTEDEPTPERAARLALLEELRGL